MDMRRKITGAVFGALLMTLSAVAGLGAQERPEEHDVAILNDHLHIHKVYVFDALGEQHLLGYVGHDELEHFDVPDDIERLGPYRVAVQQHTPLPGIGVSAEAPPYKMTPVLAYGDGLVSIVVGAEAELSSVEVH